MAQINMGRVIAGGLAGALVLNVVDFCVNGVFLADKWRAQTMKLNPNLDMMSSTAIAGYVTVDVALALVIVWLYAAIRPRFGPGPATATKAAVVVWFIAALFNSMFVINELYGPKIIAVSLAGTLVGMLAAGNLGAMIYKEE